MNKTKKFFTTLCFFLCSVMIGICFSGCFGTSKPSDLVQLPEAEYKKQCQTYQYEDIMRYPDKYNKKLAVFKGEVIQVVRQGNEFQMRVDVTYNNYYYTDTMFVFYTQKSNENFLEGDIIIMYGELRGTQKYTSVLGSPIEIPRIYVQYIQLAS